MPSKTTQIDLLNDPVTQASETFVRQVAEFQEQLGIPRPPNPVRELMRGRGVQMDEVRAAARGARNG
ncbi:MAG: hypothetical protein U9R22_09020 [Pseudomonadota bacterium]|jgi:hypothetical protein|nr:hypothetical protein [Pseudomonadota bacterium]